MGFTQIKSPMDGIIGRTQVQPGTLVAAEATVLVTVSAVDPVYVNFSIPEKEYLVAAREIEANKKPVSLKGAQTYRLFWLTVDIITITELLTWPTVPWTLPQEPWEYGRSS